MKLKIDILSNHLRFLDECVEEFWTKWSHDYIQFTNMQTKSDLASFYRNTSNSIPICYILFDEETDCIFSCALVDKDDMQMKPELSPWLSSVFTLYKHRNNGYASILIKYVVEQHDTLYLWCFNEILAKFYSKHGFIEIDCVKKHGSHENIIVMKYESTSNFILKV